MKLFNLLNQISTMDTKKIVWDGKNSQGISVSPGVYFYKAELGPLIETKKMTLIK